MALEGNITTGYSWEIDTMSEEYLVQVGEMEYGNISDSEKLVGAPGVFNYTFKSVKSGETALKIVYERPWEDDVEPIDTFTLNIKISD